MKKNATKNFITSIFSMIGKLLVVTLTRNLSTKTPMKWIWHVIPPLFKCSYPKILPGSESITTHLSWKWPEHVITKINVWRHLWSSFTHKEKTKQCGPRRGSNPQRSHNRATLQMHRRIVKPLARGISCLSSSHNNNWQCFMNNMNDMQKLHVETWPCHGQSVQKVRQVYSLRKLYILSCRWGPA